ncbi:MAG: hypothetical protein HFJ43_04110 [Clostridia bacterium]|nr:hypothetical protein [Clostridia bacterium]
MEELEENKRVILGDEEYEYIKMNNGEEILKKSEFIGKDKIDIILKDVSQGNSKDIKNYIIDVLSDLYIKRNVSSLI